MSKEPNATIENFAQVFPGYLSGVADLLIALKRACDNDLDKALIMAVVGDRHFAKRVSSDVPTLDKLGTTEVTPGPSVNALSIAQFTEIPRETVRRKVNSLIEAGWIATDQYGNLSPTQKAATDLAAGTQATITFNEKMAKVTRP